jgi:hypothetical protein
LWKGRPATPPSARASVERLEEWPRAVRPGELCRQDGVLCAIEVGPGRCFRGRCPKRARRWCRSRRCRHQFLDAVVSAVLAGPLDEVACGDDWLQPALQERLIVGCTRGGCSGAACCYLATFGGPGRALAGSPGPCRFVSGTARLLLRIPMSMCRTLRSTLRKPAAWRRVLPSHGGDAQRRQRVLPGLCPAWSRHFAAL